MTEEECRVAFENYINSLNNDFFKLSGDYISIDDKVGYFDIFLNKINGSGSLYCKYFNYKTGDIAVSKNKDIYVALQDSNGEELSNSLFFNKIYSFNNSDSANGIVASAKIKANNLIVGTFNFVKFEKDSTNTNIGRFYFNTPNSLDSYMHIININRYGPNGYERVQVISQKVGLNANNEEFLEIEVMYSSTTTKPDIGTIDMSVVVL